MAVVHRCALRRRRWYAVRSGVGVLSGPEAEVVAVADRQGTVVSRRQVLATGMSPSAVSRRLADGCWDELSGSAYRVRALRPDPTTPLWVAHLGLPGSAAASTSALWRLGLCEQPPDRPHLVVPLAWRGRPRVGTRITRSDRLLAGATVLRGMRVVRPGAALVQALATGVPGAPAVLDRALQLGHVDVTAVLDALADAAGCRGTASARAVLAAAADGAASEAERRVGAALRTAGLTGFDRNAGIGRWVVDLAFRAQRVAVEVDGWAWHTDPARFQRDRERQNDLVLAGWTVIRFTWSDAVDHPDRVVDQVRRALGGRVAI